jgi:large subunit ribosomal protein L5|uniref:Large ribosomal subunit protein uL5c n=1 Tax=Acanthoceras zachariasii TaxID=451788 RepID=A0A2U9NTY7_9STRA|nr:ribosomal protein L5 [Acanthoceras zachariasii]AWT40509.1 ribosomal protein L5 [Acanthoceras zachariasii]
MRNPNSIEEIAEIHRLLDDIKKEYKEGIRGVLKRDNPIYKNEHMIPKLEKIQINRGLGLAAQNTNILKKSIEEFKAITGQKPLITKSKKAIAGFKIRENMELGLITTLRGEKMYAFLTKLVFFTFAQIRDFRGLSVRSFDKAGNYTFGLKEQLIFPEINYEDVDQSQGFTITLVFESTTPKNNSKSVNKIFNNMSLLKFFKFPFNDCGFYEKYESLNEVTQLWDKKKQLRRKRWSQVQE